MSWERGWYSWEAGASKEHCWVAELSEYPRSDGARCPELLLGSGLGVNPPRPCPCSTGHQELHGLVTLSGQSLDRSGSTANSWFSLLPHLCSRSTPPADPARLEVLQRELVLLFSFQEDLAGG